MGKQFGGKVGKLELEKYARSKHWDGEKFVNLEETKMDMPISAIPRMLYNQLFGRKGLQPKQNIPVIPFNKAEFLAVSNTFKFIWYGHSALLMRMNNKTILIDPMLGIDAAPIAPFKIKRYNDVSLDLINDLPDIDLMILSHDHYDHIDYKSIELLRPKVKNYYVAIGVERHLTSWGIPAEDITEFDWWESKMFENIKITFTPSRHFSGRGFKDRNKGLWGGWAFTAAEENIWFSGDGGYGKHFKEIGEKLGPFDFAFMECGQYNKLWRPIHLYPDESVQAGIDGNAKKIMPVHWGSFTLSDHFWTDPVQQFISACQTKSIPYLTPHIGELLTPFGDFKNYEWWNTIK